MAAPPLDDGTVHDSPTDAFAPLAMRLWGAVGTVTGVADASFEVLLSPTELTAVTM
jgi:hypothetical protein